MRVWALILASFAAPLLALGTAAAEPHVVLDGGGARGSRSVDRTFRLRFVATNPGDTTLRDATFVAAVPSRDGAGAHVARVEASHPATAAADAAGNLAATLRLGDLPPHGTATVSIAVTLAAAPPVRLAGGRPTPDSTLPVDAPTIRALAASARGGSPAATTTAAFALVRERITAAGYRPGPADPLGALASRRGDCTDMAAALAAVCLAAGVPARVVGGWRVRGSAVLEPSRYHDWVEVDTGDGFRPVDPHSGELAPPADQCLVAITGSTPGAGLDGNPRFRVLTPGLSVRPAAARERAPR